MNRITHIGVEGAITVAINTDKQHLDTKGRRSFWLGDTLQEDSEQEVILKPVGDVLKQEEM